MVVIQPCRTVLVRFRMNTLLHIFIECNNLIVVIRSCIFKKRNLVFSVRQRIFEEFLFFFIDFFFVFIEVVEFHFSGVIGSNVCHPQPCEIIFNGLLVHVEKMIVEFVLAFEFGFFIFIRFCRGISRLSITGCNFICNLAFYISFNSCIYIVPHLRSNFLSIFVRPVWEINFPLDDVIFSRCDLFAIICRCKIFKCLINIICRKCISPIISCC